jgi:hypothetical protein
MAMAGGNDCIGLTLDDEDGAMDRSQFIEIGKLIKGQDWERNDDPKG